LRKLNQRTLGPSSSQSTKIPRKKITPELGGVSPTLDPSLGEEYLGTGLEKYVDVVWNETHYPPYCSGASLFMNKGAVNVMKNNIGKLPKIPIDDAFLGICMRKAGYSENHVGSIPKMIRV
jgi:hypothetical protein